MPKVRPKKIRFLLIGLKIGFDRLVNTLLPFEQYMHTYRHTLLMLPKWVFQINR